MNKLLNNWQIVAFRVGFGEISPLSSRQLPAPPPASEKGVTWTNTTCRIPHILLSPPDGKEQTNQNFISGS